MRIILYLLSIIYLLVGVSGCDKYPELSEEEASNDYGQKVLPYDSIKITSIQVLACSLEDGSDETNGPDIYIKSYVSMPTYEFTVVQQTNVVNNINSSSFPINLVLQNTWTFPIRKDIYDQPIPKLTFKLWDQDLNQSSDDLMSTGEVLLKVNNNETDPTKMLNPLEANYFYVSDEELSMKLKVGYILF